MEKDKEIKTTLGIGMILLFVIVLAMFVYIMVCYKPSKKRDQVDRTPTPVQTPNDNDAYQELSGTWSFSSTVKRSTPSGEVVLTPSIHLILRMNQTATILSSTGMSLIDEGDGTYRIQDNQVIYQANNSNNNQNSTIIFQIDGINELSLVDQNYFGFDIEEKVTLTK